MPAQSAEEIKQNNQPTKQQTKLGLKFDVSTENMKSKSSNTADWN